MTMPPREEEIRALVAEVLSGVTVDEPAQSAAAVATGAEESDWPIALAGVAVGADHGGYGLKKRIVSELEKHDFAVHDCGTNGTESVDYPDFAHAVARLVADGECRWGIVVDGAGIGSCMAANKVPGVRAATCWDVSSAKNSREHNHANVLALGAGLIGENLALEIVQTWLATPWGGDRHARRVDKITDIERRYLVPAGATR
jgi:ribose 5-phosphate isomerase B